jgi:acyl carrier protein
MSLKRPKRSQSGIRAIEAQTLRDGDLTSVLGTRVRRAIAQHLDLDILAIDPRHELERDLGIDPLDLVLLVLRLEEEWSIEVPVERLANTQTVSDLIAFFRTFSPELDSIGRAHVRRAG